MAAPCNLSPLFSLLLFQFCLASGPILGNSSLYILSREIVQIPTTILLNVSILLEVYDCVPIYVSG